jgi:hypothetical protein
VSDLQRGDSVLRQLKSFVKTTAAKFPQSMRRVTTHQDVGFVAFREALLRSEKLRVLTVIAFVVVFTFAMAIRIVVYGSAMNKWGLFASLLLVVYEIIVLRAIDKALRQGKDVAPGLLLWSIIQETSFPAIGISFFASPRLEFAYRPLATPWILVFFSSLFCQLCA